MLVAVARITPRPRDALPAAPYTYLLGLYLGDGCISTQANGTPTLRIACADAWPGLIDACAAAIHAVMPHNRICRVACIGCTSVVCYSKHWPCLFPQAGAGPKHLRAIELAPWQRELKQQHPWELLRGLIHSDGCRITNWTIRNGKRYEYPRYFFTNKSTDILRIFTDTLDAVGVSWRVTRRTGCAYNISIARRDSVALMDAHIGPKY